MTPEQHIEDLEALVVRLQDRINRDDVRIKHLEEEIYSLEEEISFMEDTLCQRIPNQIRTPS